MSAAKRQRRISLSRLKMQAYLSHLRIDIRKRWVEISVSLFIILGILAGGYQLFVKGGLFLTNQGDIGGILLDRLFYLGWSVIFYLLILSNIITSFSTLYRSPEVFFLMTLPMPHYRIFRIKFSENLLYSSWAILVFGIPLTIAYGRLKLLSPVDIGFTLVLGLIPFLVVATAIGLCITMLVVFLSRWFRIRSVLMGLGLVITLIFWLYFTHGQQGVIMMGDYGSFRSLDRYLANMSKPPFPLIPSHWFSQLFISVVSGTWSNLAYFGGVLFTNALLGLELSSLLAKKMYYLSFQTMEFSGQRRGKPLKNKTPGGGILRRLSPQIRGLVVKDIIQFVRTPQQWIQFLFFGFFIAIYLINLSRLDFQLDNLEPFWRMLVYLFNFGFSSFILAALTTRYVFPLISLEGKGLWVILSAPIHISQMFKQKFWLAFAVFFTLSEIVALVSNFFLSRSLYDSAVSTLFLLLISLVLISLSLGMGAVFAQYHERNPMKISSSTGGIITIVLSMLYVGLMIGILVWLLWWEKQDSPSSFTGIVLFLVLLLNTAIAWIPLKWGHKSIVKTEL